MPPAHAKPSHASKHYADRDDYSHAGTMRVGQTTVPVNLANVSESNPKMYIFDALDTNHDGKLERPEIAHDSRLAREARSLDRNRDGSLSRDEFARYRR